MKIAINTQYGGFGLSLKGKTVLGRSQGKDVFHYTQTKYGYDNDGVDEYVKITDDGDSEGFCPYSYSKDFGETTNELDNAYYFNVPEDRSDPDLISVIEDLGEKSFGSYATLKIVEIPDNVEYEIDDYDGIETIHEVHRSWS